VRLFDWIGCILGRHDVQVITMRGRGEVLSVPRCTRPGCTYVDVAGVTTHVWNRKTRRANARALARKLSR
jgi:hypothetical protein